MPKMYLDICLSDIPRELIKTGGNGKKYLKALVSPRREADKDGYDHFIAAYVPRDQRNEDDRPIFIGRAQDKETREQHHIGGQDFRKPAPARNDDDLPEDSGLPF